MRGRPGLKVSCVALAASLVAPLALAAPARIHQDAQSAAAANPADKIVQEYRYGCSIVAGAGQCRLDFTPTPAGKFATLTNASCLVSLKKVQLKFVQLLVMKGSKIFTAQTLSPVFTSVGETNWAAMNDEITAYVAAGRFVRVVADFDAGSTADSQINMYCHVSGSY
jgi:hypothetical protein